MYHNSKNPIRVVKITVFSRVRNIKAEIVYILRNTVILYEKSFIKPSFNKKNYLKWWKLFLGLLSLKRGDFL